MKETQKNSMKDRDSNFELEVYRHFGSLWHLTVSFPSPRGNKETVHIQVRKCTLIVNLQGTKELIWIKE